MPQIRLRFPRWSDLKKDWLCFIDPAGFKRSETDERTCGMYLADRDLAGFDPKPGAITWAERKKSVEHFLIRSYGGQPSFLISELDCPITQRGFEGGYQYAEGEDKLEKSEKVRPLKNEFSHPHDALQMIAGQIIKIQNRITKEIPIPGYSFAQKRSS